MRRILTCCSGPQTLETLCKKDGRKYTKSAHRQSHSRIYSSSDKGFAETPSEFKGLLELCCARISSTIAWGDGKIETAKETVKRSDELLEGISPESIENKLPFLEHIPSWIPGFLQPWRANEKRRATQERKFWLGQRAQCKALMAEKQDLTSWTKSSLSDQTLNDEEAAYTVGMLSLIGGVLESAPIQGLFITMCHFPEWQKRGQDEVDAVCGDCMPTPDYIPQLPVVRALIRALFRWRTPVPFGMRVSQVETLI